MLYWGLAIVIYPICETNVYIVSPKIKKILTPVVIERFNDKFPGENLVSCLAMFSLPTSIATRTAPVLNTTAQVNLLTKIIVWMLQQHLLVQLHTYVTMTLNDKVKCNWEDPSVEKEKAKTIPLKTLDAENEAQNAEDLEKNMSVFSPNDRQVILNVAENRDANLAKFAKVAKYMNGKYHLEEIMYHVNYRRAELLQVVDKFREILVRHEHEDPALTMYYEQRVKR
jgi:hypothetical protein